MLRQEFDDRCKKINKDFDLASVTAEMYSMIEYVYTWYPSISDTRGKDEIAQVYMLLGFGVIQDMYARAAKAAEIDSELKDARQSVAKLEHMYSQLRKGVCIKDDIDWNETN